MSRIALFVMSKKGLFAVNFLFSGWREKVSYVVVARDSNVEQDYYDEIKIFCDDHKVPCFSRSNAPNVEKDIYIFAVAWRWLINHPQEKLIVFHDSILPRFRGFAPLVNMLINGETEIGVTAILGSCEYDRGDIVAQSKSTVKYPIKIIEAIDENSKNFEKVLDYTMKCITGQLQLRPMKQNESGASYSVWRDNEDYRIDWKASAQEIKRFVDAVGYPYRGAQTRTIEGDHLIIDDVEVANDIRVETRHYGKVLLVDNGYPIVICGSGMLKLTNVRLIQSNEIIDFLPLKRFRIRFT